MNALSLYWNAFLATLAGFLQNYVVCSIAGALPFLAVEFSLTTFQQGFLAGAVLLGALVGTCVCSPLADRWGRKPPLVLGAWILLAGSVACLLANSALLLILIRFFEGIAVGIIAIIVPLYLAELAPPSKRGLFVTAYQLSLALGTFAAFFINHFYSLSGSWRLMFFATAYPACLLSLSLFSFKESPKWLLYSAHSQNVNKECLTPQGRLVFKIGAGLILFQQLSAINAFVHFFPKIFALAGCVNTQNALFFTLLVGGVNVLATFPALFLMDRMGRRVLLLLSQTGIILSLLALLFIFGVQTLCTDRMVLMALIAFIISFALGLGPVTWVLVSEIFPMTLRAKGLSCMVFLSYASSYLVVQSFPFLITHLSVATTFALYSALSIYALWFFWRWIPETKGKSLEEVQKILHH